MSFLDPLMEGSNVSIQTVTYLVGLIAVITFYIGIIVQRHMTTHREEIFKHLVTHFTFGLGLGHMRQPFMHPNTIRILEGGITQITSVRFNSGMCNSMTL